MKKRVVLWCVCLLAGLSVCMAQDVPAGVVAAFSKGSSRELDKYLSEKVYLTIRSESVSADKRAAEKAMAGFFSTNKVNSFTVNHEGKRDDSSFMVGTLKTANGDYRVNCFFKKSQNRYFIHQIRIDRTNE